MSWRGKKIKVVNGIETGQVYTVISEPISTNVGGNEYVICRKERGADFPIEIKEIEKGEYYSLESLKDKDNLQLLSECKEFFNVAFFKPPYPTVKAVVIVLREREYPEGVSMSAVYSCLRDQKYIPDSN